MGTYKKIKKVKRFQERTKLSFDKMKPSGQKSDLVKKIDQVLQRTNTMSSSALVRKMKLKEPQSMEQELLMRKKV